MRRYVRHSKHSRALALAQNMKRRAAPPAPVVKAPEPFHEIKQAPPEPVELPKADGRYVGYRIEARGRGWYALIAPDGTQVGKASRDSKELEALIPGED